jgi:Na+/phosphate symporter
MRAKRVIELSPESIITIADVDLRVDTLHFTPGGYLAAVTAERLETPEGEAAWWTIDMSCVDLEDFTEIVTVH